MGIFDKKHKGRQGEDFDSPVETVELKSKAEGQNEEGVITRDLTQRPSPDTKSPNPDQDYGIEEAIALMRTLPTENVELVVKVVKQTLESTNIDIPTIIVDATKKEERINNAISALKVEITDLEEEIANRKSEIAALEAERDEAALVKERLELAVRLSSEGSDASESTAESTAEGKAEGKAKSKAKSKSEGSKKSKHPSAST